MNAIVWVAGDEVPEKGVVDTDPTIEQLEENQHDDQPGNYTARRYD